MAPLVPILAVRLYTFAPFILPFALSFLPPSRRREKERSHAACKNERADNRRRERKGYRDEERETKTKREILIDPREKLREKLREKQRRRERKRNQARSWGSRERERERGELTRSDRERGYTA